MILKYSKNEDIRKIGQVVKAKKATVREETNGEYSLTLETPEPLFLYQLVKADTPSGLQPFIVTAIKDTGGMAKVTAQHITHLLRVMAISGVRGEKITASKAISQLRRMIPRPSGQPFTFEVGGDSLPLFTRTLEQEPCAVYDAIVGSDSSICGEYGLKVFRDNFKVRITGETAPRTEALIARRKNLLTGSERGVSGLGLVTRLHLRAKVKPEGEEEKEITAVVDSPLIGSYPVVFEKAVTVTDSDIDTAEKLEAYGKRLFDTENLDKPKETVVIKPSLELSKLVHIGQAAKIYYEAEKIYSYIEMVGYEYDAIAKEYISMNFGSLQKNLKREIAKKIKKETVPIERMAADANMRGMTNRDLIGQNKKDFEKGIGGVRQSLDTQRKEWISEIRDTKRMLDGAKAELSTLIKQTSEAITLQASKIAENERQIASLDVRADRIRAAVSEVGRKAEGAYEKASSVEQTADGIISRVSSVQRFAQNLNDTVYNNHQQFLQKSSEFAQTVESIRMQINNFNTISSRLRLLSWGMLLEGDLRVIGKVTVASDIRASGDVVCDSNVYGGAFHSDRAKAWW